MKKFTVFCFALFVAFIALESRAKVGTIYKPTGTVLSGVTPDGQPGHFLNGLGNWTSPINTFGLNNFRLPLSVDAGGGNWTLGDSQLYQNLISGDITLLGTHTFFSDRLYATNGITAFDATANALACLDSNHKISGVTIGTGLAYNSGTKTLSATGGSGLGNVTTPGGVDYGGRMTYFSGAGGGTEVIPSQIFIGSTPGGTDDALTFTKLTVQQIVLNGSTVNAIVGSTYTPSITSLVNASAATAYVTRYTRIGNIVSVSGRIAFSVVTAGSRTSAHISLPVASDLVNVEDLTGVGSNIGATGSNVIPAGARASVGDDTALLEFTPTSNAAVAGDYAFQFTYTVQ